jgi:hypothetical protein
VYIYIRKQSLETKHVKKQYMKIAALFIIAENWNQHRCSSVGEVINTGYIHIMEQDSAMKRNRVLVYTT